MNAESPPQPGDRDQRSISASSSRRHQQRCGLRAWLTVGCALAALAPSAAGPAVAFTDAPQQAGIRFVHNSGAFGRKYLPETMGSGALWFDADGDGWQDL